MGVGDLEYEYIISEVQAIKIVARYSLFALNLLKNSSTMGKKKTFCILLFLIAFSFSFGQNSLRIGGPVNYVRVGDLDVSGNQLTVEALIHYTGASVNIVSKHTDPSNVNYLLRIGSFEITTTSGFANFGGVAAAGVSLVQGETYHVAATYNGQYLRYYVNGCLTGEMAWTGNMVTNNLQTAIGQQSNCQCEQFNGYIDEVRIWNVARTQAQIAANMLDLPNPTTQAGLLAYYKFEGNYANAQGNAAWNGVAVGSPQFEPIPYPYPTTIGVTATSSPVVCSNTPTGAIDIAGNGGYLPYSYSIDGTNFSASSSFANLAPGNYTVYARSNTNCFATSTVTVQDQPALTDNLVTTDVTCNGADDGSAEITPAGGNGPAYTFQWSTGTTNNQQITNLSPGNYSVTVSDSCKMEGSELVNNGHFEEGSTGFTSDYTYCNDCFSGVNDLPGGNYLVSNDASLHHAAFQGTGNGGTGNFMIVNGAQVANTNVWCQTIAVQPNTYYVFSAYVASMHPTSPADLQFNVNGNLLGQVFTAPSATNVWNRFFSTWYSGTSTTATICIVNQNINPGGNDFGLDDISFKECVSCELQTNFVITEPTILSASASVTNEICGNNNGEIAVTATGGTGTIQYSIDNGVNFQTSSVFQNLAPGNYTIQVTDANNCSTTVTATVGTDGGPVVSAGNDQTICAGQTVTLSGSGADTYTWDNGVTDGVAFAPSGTTTYTVTGTDAFGCTATDDVTITVLSLPSIDAGVDQSICSGASVTLSGSGGDSYTWDNGVTDSQAFTPAVGAVTYTVTGTDANGCSNTDNVTVTVWALPVIDAGTDQSVCSGTSVTLSGSGWDSYVWDNGVTDNQVFTPAVGTVTYTVTGTDVNGCSNTDNVTVTVWALPAIDAGADQSVCSGTSVTLSGSGGDSYTWDNGVVDNQAFTPAVGTVTYTVTGTDVNGCSNTDNVSVTVFQLPAIDAGNDQVACDGDLITLAASGGTTYSWDNGVIDNQPFSQAVGVVIYTVTGTDANGCVNTDQVQVTVHSLPQPTFTVDNNKGCAPLQAQVINTTQGMGSGTCIWNFGNGISSASCSGNLPEYVSPGCYDIELTFTDQNGCQGVALLSDAVCVDADPVADFSVSPVEISSIDPVAYFTNESQGSDTYQWEYGDDSGQYSEESPSHEYEEAGQYTVQLIAISTNGCRDTTTKEIFIRDELIFFVPNTFTPDEDKYNEVFQPVFTSGFDPYSYKLLIFNRWGEILFESNNASVGWDGTYGGKIVPSGTYIWQIRFDRTQTDNPEFHQGHVNLLR